MFLKVLHLLGCFAFTALFSSSQTNLMGFKTGHCVRLASFESFFIIFFGLYLFAIYSMPFCSTTSHLTIMH